MKYPNFDEEKKLCSRGYKYVIGTDEAGRGPLAGPVVAGAVIVNLKSILNESIFKQVRDSKMLSVKQRWDIYNVLTKCPNVKWAIGIVSEKVIDKINIFEATKLATKRAVQNLEKKIGSGRRFLILDGNLSIESKIPQKSIIKADQKVFSCALASIFAKVTRDKIMQKYHKKYPCYGFDRHKGYGTAEHFLTLKKYGPCQIHRKSFHPVKNNFALDKWFGF